MPPQVDALAPEDDKAITANLQSCRDAWLTGDAEAVMATFARMRFLYQ